MLVASQPAACRDDHGTGPRLAATSLGLLVVLAACGGPAGSDTPAPVVTPSPTAQTSEASPQTSASPPAVRPAYPAGSLPAFLAADARFSQFLLLMERDGVLLERLLAEPDRAFTLFLPTDDAFARLEREASETLTSDDDAVTDLVERHFLYHRLPSEDFTIDYVFAGMSRRWQRMALVIIDDQVWFGDAPVIETDLRVAGGIVHLIDTVNLSATPDRYRIP